MAKSKLKLYWVETSDHDEDWFIIARNKRSAERLHENFEGYDRGDAVAEYVVTLPDDLQETKEGWPRNKLIIACGGKIVEHEQNAMQEIMGSGMRAVRFGDRIFKEGDIVSNTYADLQEKELWAAIKDHIEPFCRIDPLDGYEKILNGAGVQSLNFTHEYFARDEDLPWNEIVIHPAIYKQEGKDWFVFTKLRVKADRIAALFDTPETTVILCEPDTIKIAGTYQAEHLSVIVNFEPKEEQEPAGTASNDLHHEGLIFWHPDPPQKVVGDVK